MIAHYTERAMQDLLDRGFATMVAVPRHGSESMERAIGRARSRLRNAANRANVGVRTEVIQREPYPYVKATVRPVSARLVAASSIERPTRRP